MNWFIKLKLRSKLIVECLVLAIFPIIGINSTTTNKDTTLHLEGVVAPTLSGNALEGFHNIRANLRDLLLSMDQADKAKYQDAINEMKPTRYVWQGGRSQGVLE